jgi:hypothetical protein
MRARAPFFSEKSNVRTFTNRQLGYIVRAVSRLRALFSKMPTLEAVVADAIENKDMACLLRLAPDIRRKMSDREVAELARVALLNFPYAEVQNLWKLIYRGGEAA